jgi:hypothetical protein
MMSLVSTSVGTSTSCGTFSPASAVRSDLAAQQQKAVEVATEAYAKDKASRVG